MVDNILFGRESSLIPFNVPVESFYRIAVMTLTTSWGTLSEHALSAY